MGFRSALNLYMYLSRVWTVSRLLNSVSRTCTAGGQWDDGKQLIGRRVFVDGYGEGTVREFKKKTLPKFGASAHAIDFNPAGAEHDPAMVSHFVRLTSRPCRCCCELDFRPARMRQAAPSWHPL